MKTTTAVFLLILGATPGLARQPTAPSLGLVSNAADHAAIETLLATYTRAVSTKDAALFKTLLLNESIPFSDVGSAVRPNGAPGGTQHFAEFQRGVFGGPAFTQRFRDIHIAQDGALADVTLVFVNTTDSGTSWGWKTLQLLKLGAQWKIASEFYTLHAGKPEQTKEG